MGIIIDAHQHVWNLDRSRYEWLGPELSPIDRSIEFTESLPSLRRAGVSGTVLVEADDTSEDTELMLEVAADHPEIVAVVAYLPLDRPAEVAQHLECYRESSLIVGVRNLIHNIPDPHWLLRPDVDESLGLLESADLTFDVVSVLPQHLEIIPTLAERHPELRMVIDHLSKPPVGLDESEPWWTLIAQAALAPRVSAKVSGLYSATPDSASWTVEAIRPHLDRAIEVFTPARLMYGSDWPISILNGGYDRVWDGLSQLFAVLPEDDRDRVLGGTATEFYRIAPDRLDAATANAK